MKVNYWKYVVAALLLDIFIMGSGGSASSYKSTFDEIRNPGIGDSQFPDIFSGESLAFLALFSGIFITAAIIGILIGIFLFGPLEVGLRRVFVMGQREPANLNEIGVGFKINYWNVVKIMFFRDLYLFLWSLLFVIPGIIKWYEYRMIPYLLAENPNMSMEEAFGRSKDMTYGDKWNIFVLDLSFIGWILLAAFTANIVRIFYVGPYIYATNAELYSALKYKTGYQPAPECLNYGKPNYGAYYGNSYQGGYGNQNAMAIRPATETGIPGIRIMQTPMAARPATGTRTPGIRIMQTPMAVRPAMATGRLHRMARRRILQKVRSSLQAARRLHLQRRRRTRRVLTTIHRTGKYGQLMAGGGCCRLNIIHGL